MQTFAFCSIIFTKILINTLNYEMQNWPSNLDNPNTLWISQIWLSCCK